MSGRLRGVHKAARQRCERSGLGTRKALPMQTQPTCACGCGETPKRASSVYCRGHQKREASRRIPLAERFWEKVDKRGPDECWVWTRATSGEYGEISLGGRGRPISAHRASWLLTCGPIPPGLSVLHSCDNPPCVNPAHLFLGTQADNVADMERKGRARRRAVSGEGHYLATLSDASAEEIRSLYASGAGSQYALARRFRTTQPCVWAIVNRKGRWSRV